MRDPFTEMINFFKANPTYLVVILLIIVFFYLVSRVKKENNHVVKTKKCPMCGGSLVREDGVTRCSNFPKCRYKK